MLQLTATKQINIIVCILMLTLGGCINCANNCTNQVYNKGLKNDTVISNVSLVKVNSGCYKSGLNCDTKTIDYSYWIGKYEITNKQFFTFLTEALKKQVLFIKDKNIYIEYTNDSLLLSDTFCVKYLDHAIYLNPNGELLLNAAYANHPVISVTWYGANAFCKYYGFKLPSANEWEMAARGNNCTRFSWGNDINSSYANYFNSHDPDEPGTTPVGFYNGKIHQGFKTYDAVSPYGCYDMAGNAWEWTRDKFSPQSQYYFGKGGGFNLHTAASLQVYYVSTFRVNEVVPPLDCTHLSDGFRVVKHINN